MEEKRLKYPVGTQDFATLREEGYVYVDKTELIYNLVTDKRYIFLSRPRRFGKSLLLSTIRYYFEGRKDLFEGLKIMELEKNWKRYPVLHLELSRIDSRNPESLISTLEEQFQEWEEKFEIKDRNFAFSQRFAQIIKHAHKKFRERVVVLIDEYDNPLLNTISSPEIHESHRNLLKSIYSNLKGLDEYIKFAMLTGVSRFSNTTIFSGLNNLKDITFSEDYSTICGFTYEEIKEYLWTGVGHLSMKLGCTPEEAMSKLKDEYDGYHFSEDLTDIYNPFSVLNCLDSRKIENYWVRSGIPNFLAEKLKESRKSFSAIFSTEEDSFSLSTMDAAFDSPVSLLYQTGYLTIKGYNREENLYRLGIPNREVDKGLFYFLYGYYSRQTEGETKGEMREIYRALQKGDCQNFLERLQSMLAPISYHLDGKCTETDFQRIMFIILHILGFHVNIELSTSRSRIDMIVETQDYVYIMELKYDGSAEEAVKQIEDKEYALAWKFDGRKLYKIGINFSFTSRNIDSWIIKE